jgi:hypothetical protein
MFAGGAKGFLLELAGDLVADKAAEELSAPASVSNCLRRSRSAPRDNSVDRGSSATSSMSRRYFLYRSGPGMTPPPRTRSSNRQPSAKVRPAAARTILEQIFQTSKWMG